MREKEAMRDIKITIQKKEEIDITGEKGDIEISINIKINIIEIMMREKERDIKMEDMGGTKDITK